MTVRYAYLHSPKRHVAIARELSEDKKTVKFGIAVSHPTDNNCKKMGRTIAENRLKSKKGKLYFEIPVLEEESPLFKVMQFLSVSANVRKNFRAGTDFSHEVAYMAHCWCKEPGTIKKRK